MERLFRPQSKDIYSKEAEPIHLAHNADSIHSADKRAEPALVER